MYETHLYACHDSFVCVTWLIHIRAMTHSHLWYDSFTWVPWLIYIHHMTHSYVWHDSFICVPWLIHICDMTHLHAHHDTSVCGTWLLLTLLDLGSSMTHWCATDLHDSSKRGTRLVRACGMPSYCIVVPYWCDMTPLPVWHDSCIWLIGMPYLTDFRLLYDALICYRVATISRLLTIIGLFCKRALWKRHYSAKETYNFKEPTNCSHPILIYMTHLYVWRGSFLRVTWLLHICDMTPSSLWHDSFIFVTWLLMCMTCLISLDLIVSVTHWSAMVPTNIHSVSLYFSPSVCVSPTMGWLRLVGSIKL